MPYENKKYLVEKNEEWFAKDKVSEPFSADPLVNLPYLKDEDKVI